MDQEYRQQLEEQLRELRNVHHYDKMHVARRGESYTEPYILIRMKDREKQIAAIEARLGIVWPEPAPAPRQTYTPCPVYRPEPDLRVQQSAEVKHAVEMLAIHRRNLQHYTQQAQAYGDIRFAPPITTHGIREAREGIAHQKRILRGLGVEVQDFDGEV